MRVPATLTAIGVGLAVVSLGACSSGSKTPAASAGAHNAVASTKTSSGNASSTKKFDSCSLMSTAQASSLAGKSYTAAAGSCIASGQDQCTYSTSDNTQSLVVIVYEPTSGVSWSMMTSVLSGTGTPTPVSGVGDKAMVGAIELDVQAGTRLVAVQGAGGNLTGDYSKAVAVAKTVVAGLH